MKKYLIATVIVVVTIYLIHLGAGVYEAMSPEAQAERDAKIKLGYVVINC